VVLYRKFRLNNDNMAIINYLLNPWECVCVWNVNIKNKIPNNVFAKRKFYDCYIYSWEK